MPGVSYDSIMRVPQIVRVYERLGGAGRFFQRFFRLSPTDPATMTSQQRTFGYDLYAATRTMAPVSSPGQPPQAIGLKPVGMETATLFRFHPKITIYDERVFATRPLGSFNLNTQVDASGQKYIAMQIAHLKASLENSIEWMIAKMFQGGFGIAVDGEQFRLAELNASGNIHNNAYRIPATNTGNLDGLIASGEEWDQTNAPVLDHLLSLSVTAARLSGLPIKHIIMNGNTAIPLFNNTKLAGVGGTAYKIFDSITNRQVAPGEQLTSGEYTVIFRALPQYVFHIYNEGLVTNEVVADVSNQTSTSNFATLIPDGYAIICPEPGEWVGSAVGMEPVAYNTNDVGRVVTGFHLWRSREIDPPRWDIKSVHNFVPILPIPNALFYANVWGV